MHYGVYCRKSYFVDTSESTQMQYDICKKYLDDRGEEISSLTMYEDDGYVRSDMDRPGMNQLKEDMANHLIDCVIIYKIDRVCSDMMDFCTFYNCIKENNVKFITVKDGIDTTTPLGEAMMYLAVIFSGLEVRTDSLRITDNMNHLASEGFWCGGKPPIGYKIVNIDLGSKSHKTLEVDPEGLEFKNMITDLFLENKFSLQGLETYCKNNGIRTMNGNFLSTTQLYQTISNPQCVAATAAMYDHFSDMGCQMAPNHPREMWDGSHAVLVYGRTMERKVNGKKRHSFAPPENWRVSIGYHLPIVSDQRYFQILSQLSHNTFDRTTKYDPPLLKGVLRCKKCGRLMGVSRKKKVDGQYVAYFCSKRMRQGADACDLSFIKTEILDEKVLDIFREIEHDPAAVKKYLKDGKFPKSNTVLIRSKIQDLENQIGKLTAALATNADSAAAKYIVVQIEKLDQEYNDLKRKLMESSADERRAAAQYKSALQKREEITQLLEHFDDFTASEKNEIAQNVLRECAWDGDTLFIVL